MAYQERAKTIQEHQELDTDTTHKNALEAWITQGEDIEIQMKALH